MDDLKGPHRIELQQLELREKQAQESARRRFAWALPIATALWLVGIGVAVWKEFLTGVQVGIALGAPGAALLTILGMQVSWAYRRPRGGGGAKPFVSVRAGKSRDG